jgi:hypothetical protein
VTVDDEVCVEDDSSVVGDKGRAGVDASLIWCTCPSVADKGGDPLDGAGSRKGADPSVRSELACRGIGAANTGLRMERTRRVWVIVLYGCICEMCNVGYTAQPSENGRRERG